MMVGSREPLAAALERFDSLSVNHQPIYETPAHSYAANVISTQPRSKTSPQKLFFKNLTISKMSEPNQDKLDTLKLGEHIYKFTQCCAAFGTFASMMSWPIYYIKAGGTTQALAQGAVVCAGACNMSSCVCISGIWLIIGYHYLQHSLTSDNNADYKPLTPNIIEQLERQSEKDQENNIPVALIEPLIQVDSLRDPIRVKSDNFHLYSARVLLKGCNTAGVNEIKILNGKIISIDELLHQTHNVKPYSEIQEIKVKLLEYAFQEFDCSVECKNKSDTLGHEQHEKKLTEIIGLLNDVNKSDTLIKWLKRNDPLPDYLKSAFKTPWFSGFKLCSANDKADTEQTPLLPQPAQNRNWFQAVTGFFTPNYLV